jgi:hypothetical protein
MAKFERELSILADVSDEVSRVSRIIGINIDRRVVNETPFDTTSAKRSWLVSVGQPDNRVVDVDEGDVSTAALQAIEIGAANINQAKAYDTIYIQNLQPYIERLNEGWSEQAPAKYIDSIIEQEVAKAI